LALLQEHLVAGIEGKIEFMLKDTVSGIKEIFEVHSIFQAVPRLQVGDGESDLIDLLLPGSVVFLKFSDLTTSVQHLPQSGSIKLV